MIQTLPARHRALLVLALAAVVCAVLWPLRRGGFVYDDLWLVEQNPNLQSFGRMWASLGRSYWDFLDARSAQYVGYWRPLTTISLYLGRVLGGGDPAAFHALSLALHVVATALAFELARRITRDTAVGFLAALLFGLHPVQVEPVGWISSINDPLAGVFCFAALLAFQSWRERGSPGLPLWSAAWFACALLSKESAVAVLPLCAALDLGRAVLGEPATPFWQRLQPLRAPYLTLLLTFALYSGARIAVFGDAAAGFDRSTGHLGLTTARDLGLRIELLGGAIFLLAWPAHLNLFRDTRPEIPWNDGALWTAVLCIALLAAATLVAWRRREGALLTGLLIIPAALAPAVLRVEALGRFSLSERYLYLSAFGFALCACALASKLARRASLERLGWLALLLVAVAYGWRSRARTVAWTDERTLFATSYRDNPKSPYVAWSLGRVMLDDYRRSGQLEFLVQARDAFERSLGLGLKREDGTRDMTVLVTEEDRLQANLGQAWYWFFAALRGYDQTTLDEAEAVFEKTHALFPSSFEVTTGTGVVLMQRGKLDEARARFTQALDLNPRHLEAWYYLGKLELRRRDLGAAKAAFESALALKEDDPDTLPLYAGVLGELGDVAGAKAALDRAYALAPRHPLVLMGQGQLAANQKDGASAITWFDRMLALDPDCAPAHLQKGKVLSAMGDKQRALAELQRAGEIEPNDFETMYTLGAFLLSEGMGADALPFLEHALELAPEHELAPELRAQIALLK